MIYLDAGTTYSKIISDDKISKLEQFYYKFLNNRYYYIVPSSKLNSIKLNITASCGHMTNSKSHENEIVALARGCKDIRENNVTILDLGSRDAKWIKLVNGKFQDMDWNTSCASSTGATVEMLMKFYDLSPEDLVIQEEKYTVNCGIFGLEKIMDDISSGIEANLAVSKFVHGIAYNAWCFAKKPDKLYLSGGFCENLCFSAALKNYCKLEKLGRFKLCEGLIDE